NQTNTSLRRCTEKLIYTFKDYLDLQQFSEASQLLIDEEKQLFPLSNESQPLQEVETLRSQRQDLEAAILKTFRLSLSKEVTPQALTSAVAAMCKEDEQDVFWMRETQAQEPEWRPAKLREKHDMELKALVEDRMDNPDAQCSSPDAVKGSSIQNDIWAMGRQLKQDLETVAEVVSGCYPKEMDICNFYALRFHHVFGVRLRKIAEFGLDDNDCTFILQWVNAYYPEILQRPNLSINIADMTTYIDKVLYDAKQMWTNGEMPKTEDGCFVSETAYDIIQVLTPLKDKHYPCSNFKAAFGQCLLKQMHFSYRYKSFLEEVIRSNKSNTVPTVKANLHCIQQFRSVCQKEPSMVKVCLCIKMHVLFQPLYRKLSTDWLKGGHFKKLLEDIESKGPDLQGLAAASHQELMGRFHLDVSVEYVKRLIRVDKLKDSVKQREAHERLKYEAERLHQLFSKMGSREDWLKDVFVRIAELLRLQDLAAVQMHVASMGTSHPDITEKHVSAILKLKANFSKANRLTVKETLRDTLESTPTNTATSENTRVFYSLVPV
uniref:Exocyst complex component Sec6 n=1 Tax=Neogobius melanostomus TaxID=47308 RepID=A0A8C6SJN1_9GOBI